MAIASVLIQIAWAFGAIVRALFWRSAGSCKSAIAVFLCYCDIVKNITVAVPEDIYRKARIKAAELDTSVSALVREFLVNLGSDESDFDRRKRLQDEVIETIKFFRARDRLSRDELHDRDALR